MSAEDRRIRAAVVRIVDNGAATTVISPSPKHARRFEGDSAGLLRAVLDIYARPRTRAELFAELATLAEGEILAGPIDELVALLVADGVLVAPAPPVMSAAIPRRVVLAISGAVAAVDAPAIVRLLQAAHCDVRIALTKTAKRFVSVAALESLTHQRVHASVWQRDTLPVPHIQLAEWAELVIVCPATATTLARIAAGDCSDLVSAIVTATRAPVVIAPSMNDAMYGSPAVQDNLATLRDHGRWLVHPARGIEVAERPDARTPMLGPAPPAPAIVEIARHVLAQTPALPIDASGWERVWAQTPRARLPWTGELEAPLALALDRPPGSLLDLGTGDGVAAIAAARRGHRVTASDLAPSALGRARDRAGDLPILFVLDNIVNSHLAGPFDVVVDRGVLHCLPRASWPAYSRSIARLCAPGGTLLLVAHAVPATGSTGATTPVTEDDVTSLLPMFRRVRLTPTTLSDQPANLFELIRSDA